MEIEAMSSSFEEMKICTSDGKVSAKARPLPSRKLKPKAPTKKKITFPEEIRPPTPCRNDEDEMSAEEAYKEENQITNFRVFWERVWGSYFGSFDDETSLGPMRYTSEPNVGRPEQTLQIFSIRVTDPTNGLKWPLHVHGYVAMRDTIDHNRNYLFRRTRDNYQILTKKVSLEMKCWLSAPLMSGKDLMVKMGFLSLNTTSVARFSINLHCSLAQLRPLSVSKLLRGHGRIITEEKLFVLPPV